MRNIKYCHSKSFGDTSKDFKMEEGEKDELWRGGSCTENDRTTRQWS